MAPTKCGGFDDARQHHSAAEPSSEPSTVPAKATPSAADQNSDASEAGGQRPAGQAATPPEPTADTADTKTDGNALAAAPDPAETKPADMAPEKTAPKKLEPVLTPRAAQFKHMSRSNLRGGHDGQSARAGRRNTLILGRQAAPGEHGALLKLLRDAPADVREWNHIEYDETPHPCGKFRRRLASGAIDGRGAIHVVIRRPRRDRVVARPARRALNPMSNPAASTILFPAQYSLESEKERLPRALQTALLVESTKFPIKIESRIAGQRLFLSSDPAVPRC